MITNEQFEQEMRQPATNEALARLVMELQKELQGLRAVPKNHRPGKPGERNRYVREGELKVWGKVPQQQADIAAILTRAMEVKAEYSEAEVFNFLVDAVGDYKSLYTSKQDVTYLFKYYRGLDKKDGKHLGFVGRGFLRVV